MPEAPPVVEGVVCYVADQQGRLLLQLKAKWKFGASKWNAPGGKVLPGESPIDAARRELLEETGLTAQELVPAGLLYFYDGGKPGHLAWLMYVFRAVSWTGNPVDHGEGRLAWFETQALPYNEMWESDRHWLPRVLAGKTIEGHFWFSGEFGPLVTHRIQEEN